MTKRITMKIKVITATVLISMLFLTVAGVSNAETNSVYIHAKEKKGMLLLLVKNEMDTGIQELKITLLDGLIESARSQGWMISKDSANQIVMSTKNPISPNGREIFFINTNNLNSIISWTAKDRTGSIIAMDDARAVIKQTLNNLRGTDSTYINAMGVTVTTDKIFYKKGDNMLISGVLEPNSKITITIYTPSGQKVKIGEHTDQKGSFQALHVLHNAEIGTYIVKVSEPNAFAETTFKVLKVL